MKEVFTIGVQGPPAGLGWNPFTIDEPGTYTVVPGTLYLVDVTAGSIILEAGLLGLYQYFGVSAAEGLEAYASNSITVTATAPQTLRRGPPFNALAGVSSFVIGAGGNGADDAGETFRWINGGFDSNALTLF